MRKTAIVTGGARGIGRGCAHELARHGFDVALVDVLQPEMQRTVAELKELGSSPLAYEGDVASFARAKSIVDDIASKWGGVDVLFNNAGRAMPKGILEISEEEFDRTIAINLKSCFNYIHAVAPLMKQRGAGRIINMSSLSAHFGGVTVAVSKFAYASAKAGILGMTRALAKELGPEISVNAICPGIIKTEKGNSLTQSREPELVKHISMGRLGSPADVAQLVVFLATVSPNFITGQDFKVDGGQWLV